MLSLLFSSFLYAGTLAGVEFPDQIKSGGQTLQLNGMGLREYFFFDIYVGGLYLPFKSSDPQKIINADVPKRVQLKFIISKVEKEKLAESLDNNLKNNPSISPEVRKKMMSILARAQDFHRGETFAFDYVPGKGTAFVVNGKTMEIVPGLDFMKAVFLIYVGQNPGSEQLKQGLLGLN